MAIPTLQSLAQNLSNGIRANFPGSTNQTSTPQTLKPAQTLQTPSQPAWMASLNGVHQAANVKTPNNVPFTWSGLATSMTGNQPNQTTLTGGQRYAAPGSSPLPTYGTQATGGSTTSATTKTAPSATSTSTQASQGNSGASGASGTREASSAGTVTGNTWTSPTGAVIDTKTGQTISGPTNTQTQQSQQQAPTLQVPQTQPQGNIGQTGQTVQPMDMTYGGLIQQLLQKQSTSADEVQRMKNELTGQLGQVENRAIPLEFKTGREQTLQSIAGQRIANEQANLANLGNIYGTAIGAVKPIAGSAYALDPVTGKIVGGGAGIGQAGNVVGNLAIAQRLPEMQANLAVAQQSQDTIRNLLGAVPELNSSSFSDLNGFLQTIGKKVSDPNYQTLANTISQFLNSIAQATGQSPDAILLNTKTQGQSMQTVLANLMAQAQNRYSALSNQAAGTSLPVNTTPTIGQSLISGGTGNLGGMTADSWGNAM